MEKLRKLEKQNKRSFMGGFKAVSLHMKALFMLFCFSTTFTQVALANPTATLEDVSVSQQIQITGTVSDADGPLPGVNVLVKGTSMGVLTDMDGNYSVSVSDANAVLTFSYVGYSTQTITVGGKTVIDVVLTADVQGLEEVVVLGYTTRKRGDLTGSVSTVDSKSVQRTPSSNVAKSLAGKVPGLTVLDRGGVPGSNSAQVVIRGQSSLNNNGPLYVIDGVPGGNINFVNPADVASITVLKDGAAAIYGARAANGVIVVTTNRGKSGKPKITVTNSNRFSSFTERPRFMNSYQYSTWQNNATTTALFRAGITNVPTAVLPVQPEDLQKYKDGSSPVTHPSTDWYDLTYKDWSFQSRNSVSISGGDENTKYFLSGDLLSVGGPYESGDLSFKQYQLRSNLDMKLSSKIKFGVDLLAVSGVRNEPGVNRSTVFKHLVVNEPTEVGQFPNGLYGVGNEDGTNPRVMASNDSGFNQTKNSRLRSRFTTNIDLDFITPGLSLKGVATFTLDHRDQKLFRDFWEVYGYRESTDEYIAERGFNFASGAFRSLENENFRSFGQYFNGQLNYSRQFGDHNLSAFIAFEQTDGLQNAIWTYRRDLYSSLSPYLYTGSPEGINNNETPVPWARVNYFGSVSYDYQSKYFLDLTLRRDGNGQNFAPDNRFGNFGSVSAGWTISKESFMEDIEWISNLKLRGSYAIMGNDNLGGGAQAFDYERRYRYSDLLFNGNILQNNRNYYIFGETPYRLNTFFNDVDPNPNITWETSIMKNIGLTFGMFDQALTGDLNFFHERREDILRRNSNDVPAYSGVILPAQNIGIVENKGFELELAYKGNINDDFSYTLGATLAYAKNEIVYIAEGDVPEWQSQEGNPSTSILKYPSDGIINNQAELDAYVDGNGNPITDGPTSSAFRIGDVKYIDTDGNGVINANDQVRDNINNFPRYTFGFNLGLNYKQFSMNALFQGQTDAQIQIRHTGEGNRPVYQLTDGWSVDNQNASLPGNVAQGGVNDRLSDAWLYDASFLRLRELEVGYTVPRDLTHFADVRVTLSGQNLITWHKLPKGFDPEVNAYTGFTNGQFAPMKTIALGFNFSF